MPAQSLLRRSRPDLEMRWLLTRACGLLKRRLCQSAKAVHLLLMLSPSFSILTVEYTLSSPPHMEQSPTLMSGPIP